MKKILVVVSTILMFCNVGYTDATGNIASYNKQCYLNNNIKSISNVNIDSSKVLKTKQTTNINTNYKYNRWANYSELSEYYKKVFDSIKKDFKVESYEEFTRKYNVNSLTEQDKEILSKAEETARLEETKDKVTPTKEFLIRITKTNAFNMLVSFVKEHINELKSGKQVNFKQIFKSISKNMNVENNKAGKKYEQTDIELIANDVLNYIRIKQSLIYFALSKVDKDYNYQFYVNEQCNVIEKLTYKDTSYADCIDMDCNFILNKI